VTEGKGGGLIGAFRERKMPVGGRPLKMKKPMGAALIIGNNIEDWGERACRQGKDSRA